MCVCQLFWQWNWNKLDTPVILYYITYLRRTSQWWRLCWGSTFRKIDQRDVCLTSSLRSHVVILSFESAQHAIRRPQITLNWDDDENNCIRDYWQLLEKSRERKRETERDLLSSGENSTDQQICRWTWSHPDCVKWSRPTLSFGKYTRHLVLVTHACQVT